VERLRSYIYYEKVDAFRKQLKYFHKQFMQKHPPPPLARQVILNLKFFGARGGDSYFAVGSFIAHGQ